MKISIIGAGNVGSIAALRIAEQGLGDIILVDVVKGLAEGKSLDLADAQGLANKDYSLKGADDITQIKDSSIVVITAGFARRPGMKREDLLRANAEILQGIALNIKQFCPRAIVIVVTNPVDIMTYFVLKATGFKPSHVFGMGISLDASRFSNLIAEELKIPATQVEACVIGAHGEGMVPLARFSYVEGKSLDRLLDKEKITDLVKRTVSRGAEIVGLLGSGSAYFAPSAAVAELVRIIAKDEKRIVGICAYLNGEYGLKDMYIGVPCRLGRGGVEEIVKLDLNNGEKAAFLAAASSIKEQLEFLPSFY